MPIVSGDILTFGAASMNRTDSASIQGGQMSTGHVMKVVWATLTATGSIWCRSEGADVSTIHIWGRNAAGEIVNETITLNGTATVRSTLKYERLLRGISVNNPATIQYVLKDKTTGTTGKVLMTFDTTPFPVNECRRLFYNSSAEPSGSGTTKWYYEKVFFYNKHTSLTLTGAQIAEQADPLSKLTFWVTTTLNEASTINKRLSQGAPPSELVPGATFTSGIQNVANSQNHTAGSRQGVWVKLILSPGDSASKSTYTLRESGTST